MKLIKWCDDFLVSPFYLNNLTIMGTKNFKELTENIDMVLFNNIINIDANLELVIGKDYDEEYGECIDIYQYFAINESDGIWLSEKTELPLYYSEVCDLYVLGITFYGTPWEGIEFNI